MSGRTGKGNGEEARMGRRRRRTDAARRKQRPTENRTHRRQETAEGGAEIPPRMPPATKPMTSEGERRGRSCITTSSRMPPERLKILQSPFRHPPRPKLSRHLRRPRRRATDHQQGLAAIARSVRFFFHSSDSPLIGYRDGQRTPRFAGAAAAAARRDRQTAVGRWFGRSDGRRRA